MKEARASLAPLGDRAVLITLGNEIDEALNRRVRALAGAIRDRRIDGVTEAVPAYASVLVHYDPLHIAAARDAYSPYAALASELSTIIETFSNVAPETGRSVEISTCYGGELGPDLDEVAARHTLTADRVVELHAGAEYVVFMVGFMPGFAYLGGLPGEIATPRRSEPRTHVPAGSVGIGGHQTGVYPMESPGGWNLIGRTPRVMFDAQRDAPSLLRSGDRVRFVPMTRADFDAERSG